ncbi:MAG: branched-chain amino acid ABC transporter permease [Candidatus Acidiferrales bacterium]
MRVLQLLEFGLATGSFLVIATLGFGLVARVNKFLNIAHTELISIAAFVTYLLQVDENWPFLAAAATAILVTVAVAVITARLIYSPLHNRGSGVLLITSVGVLYLLHGITEMIVLPGVYAFKLPRFAAISLAGLPVEPIDLIVVGVTVACVLILYAILAWTRIGLAIRAFANDQQLAASRGIDINQVAAATWILTGFLAGVAGIIFGLRSSLTTDLAFDQLLLIISVSILAGLGNLFGIVIAGLALGLAMDLSTLVIPTGYREAVAFAIVILVLTLRPQGLTGARVARREA